jgi:hypothetical protein
MITSQNRQLPLSLDLMAGQNLSNWLNRACRKTSPVRAEVEYMPAYIRWVNSRKDGDCPPVARLLFARQFTCHVSRVGAGRKAYLELMGRSHLDNAAWFLVVLSRSGNLVRMRECPRCEQWFYAEKGKRKSCSDACRSAYFAAHKGKERAALHNRKWRIKNFHLDTVDKRIRDLQAHRRPLTESETFRLGRARVRRDSLKNELREIEGKLVTGRSGFLEHRTEKQGKVAQSSP